MRNFFSKKNADVKMEGSETPVASGDYFSGDAAGEDTTTAHVDTELSIHPDWKLPQEDVYSFRFLNIECDSLLPNQLSIAGIKLDDKDSEDWGLDATVFFRHSMNKTIELGETTLALLDQNDQVLGRKTLSLKEVGKLPPKSSRPWVIPFTKDELNIEEKPEEGWKVVFQLKPSARKHSLDLDEKWQKTLPSKDIQDLESLVERLDKPKATEVNLLGLKAAKRDNGDIQLIILIRNGSEKTVNLEKVPLVLEDAEGDELAKAVFSPKDLKVKANTSKPWVFIFPEKMIKKEEYSIDQWKVYMPKSS
ncbi:accessory Sec system S-layer assembly protein [Geomicrobium sp. JSM 1781026]|uniref:accessory Sec system S-layer assembly protein n=1 Tax=Geomicrobium sp. JSM 1781026 TaxID=3344580 RepID=UPI0035C1CCE5